MTTATLAAGNRTTDTETARPRRSLEELVDRVIDALFKVEPETAEPSVAQTIHEARRLRQAGDMDAALATFAGMDMGKTTPREVRWAFSEWKQVVKRRFGARGALVYSQGTGRAAALVPRAGDLLEVAAVLGMRWRPGKAVSALDPVLVTFPVTSAARPALQSLRGCAALLRLLARAGRSAR